MSRIHAVLFLCCCLAASSAQAGLGPENICLVVNSRSWASRTIANHYAEMRHIPPRNVVEVDWPAQIDMTTLPEFRLKLLTPILKEIQLRGLAPQIDAIVYSSDFPYAVRFGEGKSPAERLAVGSLTSMTSLAPASLAEAPPDFTKALNPYAARALTAKERPLPGFQSRIGRAGSNVGEPIYLSVMLAYTSGRGNSVEEALAYLERSAAADGAIPKGTIYYCRNSDVRSTTRERGFADAVTRLEKLGVAAAIADGELPDGKNDVQGAMLGVADFSWKSSRSTIKPGAICEHLTSYGGILHPRKGQTPLSELLRYGAAGTSGTVVEPYAVAAKFPDPLLHVFYAQGATLAEAFYASVLAPYQLLIVGEPLCTPWAKMPKVSVQGLAADEVIDAKRSVTVALENVPAGYSAANCDWFLDGLHARRGKLEEPFEIDATALGQGWHELRAVAISADAMATQARAIVPFNVAAGANVIDATWNCPAKAIFGETLQVELSATGAKSIELFHNAVSLGRIRGAQGKIALETSQLGMGPVRLTALATVPGGRPPVAFAPKLIEIAPPVAHRSATPPVSATLARGIELQWPGGKSGVAQSTAQLDWLAEAGVPNDAPFTGDAWFNVDRDDVYQFQLRFNGQFSLSVDGRELFSKDTRLKEQHFIPVALKAGQHRLQLKGKSIKVPNCDLRFGSSPVDFLEGQNFRHVN